MAQPFGGPVAAAQQQPRCKQVHTRAQAAIFRLQELVSPGTVPRR
jgi:hypothetical protein